MTYREYDQDVDDLQINGMHRAELRKLDDGNPEQYVDYGGLEGEEHTEVLRVRPHGMISNPGKGAQGIVTTLGTRDMPVFFGGEHPEKRPKGLPDWSAGFYDGSGLLVYGDGQGNVFVKKAKTLDAEVIGDAKLKAAKITLEAPEVVVTNKLIVGGDIEHAGNMTTGGVHVDSNGVHI
ncbi:MAG: phage baseplate assembly protein [Hyphomicrobiaceae bacterium]